MSLVTLIDTTCRKARAGATALKVVPTNSTGVISLTFKKRFENNALDEGYFEPILFSFLAYYYSYFFAVQSQFFRFTMVHHFL